MATSKMFENWRRLISLVLESQDDYYTTGYYVKRLGGSYHQLSNWMYLMRRELGVEIRYQAGRGIIVENPEKAREIFNLNESV